VDRETYTETLIPLALRLVATVHDEGPDDITGALAAIHAITPPDGLNTNTTLAVLLAAMVNPNRTPIELLGWTQGLTPTTSTKPAANPLAIEMALAGVLPASALNPDEIHQVVMILIDRGYTEPTLRDHLHADHADVRRWTSRARGALRTRKQAS
jgi:hypothetical protein